MNYKTLNVNLILLCGGQGTRFSKVSTKIPKVLVKIANKFYLEYVFNKCNKHKIQSIILATGHLHEKVKNYVENSTSNLNIYLSKEETPLGTWGAILNSKKFIDQEYFFVMNGDTFNNLNLNSAYEFQKKNRFECVFFGSKANLNSDTGYGLFRIDNKNTVLSFNDNANFSNNAYFNSGIYLLKSDILKQYDHFKKGSFEKDIIPLMIKKNYVGFYNKNVKYYDYGTYERYIKIRDTASFQEWV